MKRRIKVQKTIKFQFTPIKCSIEIKSPLNSQTPSAFTWPRTHTPPPNEKENSPQTTTLTQQQHQQRKKLHRKSHHCQHHHHHQNIAIITRGEKPLALRRRRRARAQATTRDQGHANFRPGGGGPTARISGSSSRPCGIIRPSKGGAPRAFYP